MQQMAELLTAIRTPSIWSCQVSPAYLVPESAQTPLQKGIGTLEGQTVSHYRITEKRVAGYGSDLNVYLISDNQNSRLTTIRIPGFSGEQVTIGGWLQISKSGD